MTTPAYHIGAEKRLTGNFTDIAGDPADATAITLTIREPDGVLVTKAIGDLTHAGTGQYYFDYLITKQGRHIVNWNPAGGVIAAFETDFYALRKEAQ